MTRGLRVWVGDVELTPAVREIAIAPAGFEPEGFTEGTVELGRSFDPVTLEHSLEPDEWAALTEHVVVSGEPGEL